MPPKKVLFLASLYDNAWFEHLFRAEGYSVVKFDSGEETLNSLLVKEPDLLVLFGFPLHDMTIPDLIKKVNEVFPNRKFRLMYLHPTDFHTDEDIKWNVRGADVAMPCYFPNDILLPILRKIEAMDTPGTA